MVIWIMHISDLHRDPEDEISTASLLHSIEIDWNDFKSSQQDLIAPDFLVVSGDLIQGAKPSSSDPPQEIQRQYDDSNDFLTGLVDRLLNGDKNKLVIVPGNHDVSSQHFLDCLTPVNFPADSDDKLSKARRTVLKQLSSSKSPIRWDWESVSFFEISDREKYDRRFDPFCNFYSKVYNGARTYSLNPSEQFDIFDFPAKDIVFVGFNSCYDNDLYNRRGRIHPDAISAAYEILRGPQYASRLRIAVWHHNTRGGPTETDYMDARTLQTLINHGFALGLHGHQHQSQYIDESFVFGENKGITVISAGTLCGSPRSLPISKPRSFNIIALDTDKQKGVLNLRQMQNDDFRMPIWGPGIFTNYRNRPIVEFDLHISSQGEASTPSGEGPLEKANELIDQRDFPAAITILETIADSDMARILLIQSYVREDEHTKLIDLLDHPRSNAEIVYLTHALSENGQHEELQSLLKSPLVAESDDPTIQQLTKRYMPGGPDA